jgi:release factor glutamine methyltransferase
MNLKQALKQASIYLEKYDFPEHLLEAEVLLMQVLGITKEQLFKTPEAKLSCWQILKLRYFLFKRKNNWPIAYLTGHKEFYGLDFVVNKNVLIPRPLSEEIIEQALNIIKANQKRPLTIVDVGTGSGCLIIALAKTLLKTEPLENFKFLASDISAAALKVAKQNTKLHGLEKNITFLQGSLLEPFNNTKIDLIITNLPYLTPKHLQERSIKKEPRLALVGDLYPELIRQVGNRHACSLPDGSPQIIKEDLDGVAPAVIPDLIGDPNKSTIITIQ